MSEEMASLDFEKPIIELEKRIAELKITTQESNVDVSGEVKILEEKAQQLRTDIYGSLTPWQRVQIARHPRRPYTLDYIKTAFADFVELHGDRLFADDSSLVCGMATLNGKPCMVMGHQKGRDLHENIERNFGMPNPEGYRKALRLMKMAEKFNLPLITFIDTAGAYPGIGAEERGQSEAIARNLREMADLKIPVVSIIIGEGGSGGALGIGVANRILMMENAYYSVISPEGCAAILFHDAARAQDAATALKITAQDLKELGIIDEIVAEPLGGAHHDAVMMSERVKEVLTKHLEALLPLSPAELVEDRYRKFRNIGVFERGLAEKPAKKKKTKIDE
jgi:acetyl-CoA carboxylase carboxyl transferase subunit alpha